MTKTRELLPGADAAYVRGIDESIAREEKARWNNMSPPGALDLPDLLEVRRQEHLIVDQVWAAQPVYDRIWIYQTSDFDERTFSDKSKIVLAESIADAEKKQAPCGVLVSAGLRAMDQLFSNGIHLGDIVEFIEIVPYRRRVGFIDGWLHVEVLVMRAGDIMASQDLAKRIRSKRARLAAIRQDPNDESTPFEHCYIGPDGKPMPVVHPHIREDK